MTVSSNDNRDGATRVGTGTTTTTTTVARDDVRRPNGLVNFLTLASFANLSIRDIGLLVLRLFPLLLMFHGWDKFTGWDNFINGKFGLANNPVSAAAPQFFGFLVTAGQLLLPIFILIGLFTRWCGLLMSILFAFIIFAVNVPTNGFWSKYGGVSFEASLFYLVMGLALFFLGAGRLSADHALNKREDLVGDHYLGTDRVVRP